MSDLAERPLVTFALFAYNQERYIKEAVEAALAQDYSPLEIILSDDCSTDATFDHMTSLVNNYSGAHEVILNRNPINCGISRHFNEIVSKAKGEIVVVAAGDDISLSGRVSKTVKMFAENPTATVVAFSDFTIDATGAKKFSFSRLFNFRTTVVTLEKYLSDSAYTLSGASRGFLRMVYKEFGDLNEDCPTEDSPYLLRCLLLGSGIRSSEPGILYRRHSNNLSSADSLNSMNFEAIKKQYLDDSSRALVRAVTSPAQNSEIAGWIERNIRRREISVLYSRSQQSLVFFFDHVVKNKDFSTKEKIALLMKILKGKIVR